MNVNFSSFTKDVFNIDTNYFSFFLFYRVNFGFDICMQRHMILDNCIHGFDM